MSFLYEVGAVDVGAVYLPVLCRPCLTREENRALFDSGGKSGRSKYWQIAMLSAMATACTTCHGRDAIKVKCLQHLNTNICNTNTKFSLFCNIFLIVSLSWMDVRQDA